MEAVFYFTRAPVQLEDVERLARDHGYKTESGTLPRGARLNVFYDAEIVWQWVPMHEEDGDLADFTRDEREMVHEYGPSAIFMITCHVVHLGNLALLLRPVMERFGGWVCRNDLTERYTAANIHDLPRSH